MPVTLTIKKVPERVAEQLRARAAANHRSLQGELMVILTESVAKADIANEPDGPAYEVKRRTKRMPAHGRRLTLRELWERSRQLGSPSKAESAAIVRTLRDERHRR